MLQEVICIVCPRGCRVVVDRAQEPWSFSGNSCNRGPIYASQELTAPKRMLTTTLPISGALVHRLPVASSGEVPKEQVIAVIKALAHTQVQAPITMGQVIVHNILDLEVDIVATRTLEVLAKNS
jgi:CxxC motif-containing protein